MPPPKKAAKKAIKKAAKETAGPLHRANDLRRAFEHMGRLEVLGGSLNASTADAVDGITQLAQKEIEAGNNKDAADLLRASEHLSFAVLVGDRLGDFCVSAELEQSITEQFHALLRKANEHWQEEQRRSGKLSGIYESCRKSAVQALQAGAYHQALEFARAAEALAHVRQDGPHKLERGAASLQLTGSSSPNRPNSC